MVSLLGDYFFCYPQGKPLKLKLKDMLEAEIDEKYYLKGSAHTMGGGGQEIKIFDEQNGYIRNDDCVGTLTTDGSSPKHNNRIVQNCRVRKLTPKECWRLMGFSDEDFDKAKKSGMSNSQLYKQAGNSIVVPVLEAIFRELIGKVVDE